MLLLIPLGCSTDDGVLTAGTPGDPMDGYWEGLEVEFVLREGTIESLLVLEQPCDDGGCVATCEGQVCTTLFHGNVEGTFALGRTVQIETTELILTGSFSGPRHVAGKITKRGQSGCCERIGAWAAEWVAPLGGGPIGPGGPGTGKPGPVDWGGHSTGTLHPGPALGGWEMALGEGFSEAQIKAFEVLNDLRVQLGAAPVAQDPTIAQAAQAHAEFYVAHASDYTQNNLSPHSEDPGFGAGYTGANHGQRMKAAGFDGTPGAEIMAFTGGPAGAIAGWLATLYHRIPLLDPRSAAMGFGMAQQGNARTEVMDFGVRGGLKDDPIIVYPWPGQDNVPRSWNGGESPQPKPPPSGYPSGPIITATMPFAAQFGDDHQLLDPEGNPVPHMWLTPGNDPSLKTFGGSSVAVYAHAPLAADTTYTVTLPLRRNAEEHTLIWRFTTASK